MRILLINFGATVIHHYQAAFSIYSLLKGNPEVQEIIVLTDAPDYYRHLQDHITVTRIDAATLKEWIGPHEFFFRAKIKAIEMVCNQYPGEPVLYLDTDTFAFRPLRSISSSLSAGTAVMHIDEGPFSKARTKSGIRIWKFAQAKAFSGHTVTPADAMWNAGVVGTPNTKKGEECTLALAICDAICAAGVRTHMNEQFAVSLALQKLYGITEAQSCIAHYWSNKKEWNSALASFFTTAYLKSLTIDQTIQLVSDFNYKELPIQKKERNTARRLHTFVDRLFPAASISYLQPPGD